MISFDDIENIVSNCRDCPLSKTRNNVVLGGGNPHSKIMFIGEAPGEQEDLQGRVFVGPAGKLLDKMFAFIGLTRDDVYISNILKCRPPMNRNPKPEEQQACLPYLRAQVKLIKPRIIVCLGRISAQVIINPEFKITKDHGKWTSRGEYNLIATFHPSALLRDPQKKWDAKADLEIIRAKIDELHLLED